MPLYVSSTCAHHQKVKTVLHNLWYHHTYRCDDTRGCVIQFWHPDDEHMYSKHIEAWNKLIVKQKFCAPSWLITEINTLRCTVSKTSKFVLRVKIKTGGSKKIEIKTCLCVWKYRLSFKVRNSTVWKYFKVLIFRNLTNTLWNMLSGVCLTRKVQGRLMTEDDE